MLKLLKLELRQQQQHLRWLVFLALIRSDAIITVTTLNNATKYMTTTTNSKIKKDRGFIEFNLSKQQTFNFTNFNENSLSAYLNKRPRAL